MQIKFPINKKIKFHILQASLISILIKYCAYKLMYTEKGYKQQIFANLFDEELSNYIIIDPIVGRMLMFTWCTQTHCVHKFDMHARQQIKYIKSDLDSLIKDKFLDLFYSITHFANHRYVRSSNYVTKII